MISCYRKNGKLNVKIEGEQTDVLEELVVLVAEALRGSKFVRETFVTAATREGFFDELLKKTS